MKLKEKLLVILLGLAMMFAFISCGQQTDESSEVEQDDSTVAVVNAETKTSGKVGAVKWNSKKGTVSFSVTVNQKMLKGKDVTHFIINDMNGKKKTDNAGKGLFTTKAKALDLYEALVKAGATPWTDKEKSNAVKKIAKGKTILDVADSGNPEYSKLEMTFKRNGKTYTPQDLISFKASGVSKEAPIQMCFTGNYYNQQKWNSGCVACIFSCYAGITSNESIGFGTTNKKENYFYAKKALKKGQKYTVTYKIK